MRLTSASEGFTAACRLKEQREPQTKKVAEGHRGASSYVLKQAQDR